MKTTITITNATHGKLIELLIQNQKQIDEFPQGQIEENGVVLTWSTVMGCNHEGGFQGETCGKCGETIPGPWDGSIVVIPVSLAEFEEAMDDVPNGHDCDHEEYHPDCGFCRARKQMGISRADSDLPGMWERADFTGGDPSTTSKPMFAKDKVKELENSPKPWLELYAELVAEGYNVRALENTGYHMQKCDPLKFKDPDHFQAEGDNTIVVMFI